MLNIEDIKPTKMKIGDYVLGKTIGTGAFGVVKIAKNKHSKEYLAIKIFKKSEIIKYKQELHLMNEIRILSRINHCFMVNSYIIFLYNNIIDKN